MSENFEKLLRLAAMKGDIAWALANLIVRDDPKRLLELVIRGNIDWDLFDPKILEEHIVYLERQT